jgi:hypothetical protein
MTPPTCQEICDEAVDQVYRSSDPSWRHGTYEHRVYHRESDNTFWAADFRLSTCGETNELREGFAEIYQVWPVEVTKTEYTTKQPA